MTETIAPGRAPAPPGDGVTPRRERVLVVAALGFWIALFGPMQVLLPLSAADIDPAGKERLYGAVTLVGCLVLLLAYPLLGALSDRYRHVWGRRPFAGVGIAIVVCGLTACAVAADATSLLLGWAICQVGVAAIQCSVETSFADSVARVRRPRVAGLLAAAQMGGALVGSAVATVTPGRAAGYLAVGAVTALVVLPLAVGRDRRTLVDAGAPDRGQSVLVDLVLAWTARFCVLLGFGCVTQFLLYYVADHLGAERPEQTMLLITAVFVLSAAGSAAVVGRLARRLGGVRLVSAAGAGLAGISVVTFGATTAVPTVLAAAVAFGLGLGAFLGTAFSVITDNLPSPRHHGRDLGVLNGSVVLPQAVSPIMAVALLSGDGTYGELFRAAGVVIVVGGLAMLVVGRLPVRSPVPGVRK